MELQNRQQEGRWQSGSSGHTNLSPNRQPEMHEKRWASNGFLLEIIIIVIIIVTFGFDY